MVTMLFSKKVLKRTKLCLILCLGMFSGQTMATIQSREIVDVNDILDSVKSFTDLTYGFSFTGKTIQDWERIEENKKGKYQKIHELRWDGRQSDIILEDSQTIDGELTPTYLKRVIWNGEQYQLKQDALNVSGEIIHSSMGFSNEKERNGFLTRGSYGGHLFGYIEKNMHISELLKKSPSKVLQEEMEEIDGSLCYVIEGLTSEGAFKILIDPNSGFNIRKISGENMYDSFIVKMELSDVKLKEIEGNWIPVSGTYSVNTSNDTGKLVNSHIYTTEISKIKINPDFDEMGAFKMDVPDGTIIDNYDFPGILYTWQNGNIVPYIDSMVFDAIEEEMSSYAADEIKNENPKISSVSGPNQIEENAPLESKQLVEDNDIQYHGNRMIYSIITIIMLVLLVTGAYIMYYKHREKKNGK